MVRVCDLVVGHVQRRGEPDELWLHAALDGRVRAGQQRFRRLPLHVRVNVTRLVKLVEAAA